MALEKKYINEEQIAKAFSNRGILGVKEFFGDKIDIFLFEDTNSETIFEAYEKDDHNSVAYLLTELVLKYR
tara:strand:+ start:182 stop:394 length:213 start_codon:yes stop_codon:yes gene_type:complete